MIAPVSELVTKLIAVPAEFDVNTPYPIHGMPKAMNLEPSKLGYAALVFGLSGTLTALFVMYWMYWINAQPS